MLWGPTCSERSSSSQATLPPPAPMLTQSTAGTIKSWRSTVVVAWDSATPSTIIPTSKLVPPMSVVMMLGRLSSSPSFWAAMIPPTGPE